MSTSDSFVDILNDVNFRAVQENDVTCVYKQTHGRVKLVIK